MKARHGLQLAKDHVQIRPNCPRKHPSGEVCALAGAQRSSLHPFSGRHFTTIWTRLWHVSTNAPGPNFLPSIILQQGWYHSLEHQQQWACVIQQAWAASGRKRGPVSWMSCDMKAGVRIHRCDFLLLQADLEGYGERLYLYYLWSLTISLLSRLTLSCLFPFFFHLSVFLLSPQIYIKHTHCFS